MKNIILPVLAVFFMSSATAQSDFGVKASIGVNLAADETTYAGEAFDYINHEVAYRGSDFIKSIGLYGQKKFGFLFARAEASYTTFQQEYHVRSHVRFGQPPRNVFEDYHFADFHVISGVTHDNIRFGVGPVAHILLDRSEPLEFISGYNENNRVLTWGFVGTVGFDLGKIALDLRYTNNFRNIGDHINYGNRDAGFAGKPHTVSVVVGYNF